MQDSSEWIIKRQLTDTFQLKSHHIPAAAILLFSSAGSCWIKLHIYFRLSIPGLKVAPASIVEALVFKSLLSIKHKCNTGGTSSATYTLKVWEGFSWLRGTLEGAFSKMHSSKLISSFETGLCYSVLSWPEQSSSPRCLPGKFNCVYTAWHDRLCCETSQWCHEKHWVVG